MLGWQCAAARRSKVEGIGQGMAGEASMAVLLGGWLGPKMDGMLRAIVSDGVWTQEKKFRARLADSLPCPHCAWEAVEDHAHMWWRCPAWGDIRSMHPRALRQYLDDF